MSASLDALQGLASNKDNPNGLVQGGMRNKALLLEMKRNLELARGNRHMVVGATNADVEDLQSTMQESPNFGHAEQARIAGIQDTNNEIQEYNRPDVGAVRHDQEAAALRKIILPIQERGKYDVEAAKQTQIGRNEQTDRLIAGRQGVVDTQQQHLDGRAAATGQTSLNRTRLGALQTGKAHAARKGGFWDMLTGPKQSDLDNAEIAQLLGQQGGGGGGFVNMVAPDGQPLQVPEAEVAEAEALGARRR